MKELRVEYRIAGLNKSKVIQIPSAWKELTPDQFIAAAKMYVEEIAEDDFLKLFFDLSRKLVQRLNYYQKYKLVELVEFVRDARVPYSNFFLSSIPDTGLMAPGARLNGMCLQQFMTVDTFFSKYVFTGNKEYLDKMVASLYLREEERYFIQDKDSEVKLLDLNARLPEIQKIDITIKYAVFLNFLLIKRWLGRAYVHLFPESEETALLNVQKSYKHVDWLEIFDSFVGDNIPDMDKYQAMAATDAFRIINRKIREAKKNGNH